MELKEAIEEIRNDHWKYLDLNDIEDDECLPCEIIQDWLEEESFVEYSLQSWLDGVAGWGGRNVTNVDAYRSSHTVRD